MTSPARLPTKIRKWVGSHSRSVGSVHDVPPPDRWTVLGTPSLWVVDSLRDGGALGAVFAVVGFVVDADAGVDVPVPVPMFVFVLPASLFM